MRRIAVGDIMTRKLISVKPEASLYECAKKMARERVDTMLVTNSNKLVGILTARDVLWAITKKSSVDLNKINVMDVATKKVAVTKPSSDISQALRKMQQLSFRRLPVLSKGEIIGVVTLKDILRVEPSFYTEVTSFMDVREEDRKLKETEIEWPQEGFCANCGAFAELLKVYDQLLCPDCREELY